MRRPIVFVALVGTGTVLALWLLLQSPGSIMEALSHPLRALIGTQQQLNSTLLEVSETSAEPVRAASRRLLQPLGAVRIIRIYDTPDAEPAKKR